MKNFIMLLQAAIFLFLMFLNSDTYAQSGAEKVEACIETLREQPATKLDDRHMSMLISSGYDGFPGLTIYEVGDKKFSQEFDSCMSAAEEQGDENLNIAFLGDESYNVSFSLKMDSKFLEDMQSRKVDYVFADGYENKYVFDVKEKKKYELVRIPPAGSIEALGTWTGTVTAGPGCKNSYGDPCGTKYDKSRAGYERK